MFPTEILIAYLAAVLVVVIAPGITFVAAGLSILALDRRR